MTETSGIREPFTVKPVGTAWAPDTFRGKIDQVVGKAKETYARYFQGANPVVKTKLEEEQPLKK